MELTKEQIYEKLTTWLGDGSTEESMTRALLLLGAVFQMELTDTALNDEGRVLFTFEPCAPATTQSLEDGTAFVTPIDGALCRIEHASATGIPEKDGQSIPQRLARVTSPVQFKEELAECALHGATVISLQAAEAGETKTTGFRRCVQPETEAETEEDFQARTLEACQQIRTALDQLEAQVLERYRKREGEHVCRCGHCSS